MELQAISHESFDLDPRTKLLLLITTSVIFSFSDASPLMSAIKLILVMLPCIFLFFSRRTKEAVLCLALYCSFSIISSSVVPNVTGVTGMILSLCSMIFSRILPSFLSAFYLFSTTTVSDFITAMERMHFPAAIFLPLAVVFRLFPAINEERKAINEAMEIRAIKPVGTKWINYHFLPLMTCMIRIGDELSASALTKGLGSSNKRQSIRKLAFRFIDFVTIGFCIGSLVLFIV